MTQVKPSTTTVRAFDGSKRDIAGEVDLEVEIGPQTFTIPFQVLDIPRTFNLLLGRPWIHSAGAIPSSLHQKVKFIANGQIVTILGEQDYSIYKDTAIPYIGEENPEDLGLQIFKEVHMLQEDSEKGKKQVGTFGLGYSPTSEEIQEMKWKIRNKRGEQLYDTPMAIPDINSTFLSPGYVQKTESTEKQGSTDISQDEPTGFPRGSQAIQNLNNWFSIPVVGPALE